MPPKAKFTREEIVLAALEVTRRSGIRAVTARVVGAELKVSTRPIFTYFNSIDELKSAVLQKAKEIYRSRLMRGMEDATPFLGIGKEYIRFAIEEKQLYRLIFLEASDFGLQHCAADTMRETQELLRGFLMKKYKLDAKTADSFYFDIWLAAHGIATLLVSEDCPIEREQIPQVLSRFSIALFRAYKQIPGFVDGSFDKDRLYKDEIK